MSSALILADTSVWIRYLANAQPFASELDDLLSDKKVLAHQMIYGELLIGDVGGRLPLLSEYVRLPQALVSRHRDVVALVRDKQIHGRGIGWVDSHLLASAYVYGYQLWAVDLRLHRVADELGIAYSSG
jgi:hypothetical protein